jgi:hypothetical protein
MSQMVRHSKRDRKLLSRQTYEITTHTAESDILSIEVLWTGPLAVPFGNVSVGSQMRCHSAMFVCSKMERL